MFIQRSLAITQQWTEEKLGPQSGKIGGRPGFNPPPGSTPCCLCYRVMVGSEYRKRHLFRESARPEVSMQHAASNLSICKFCPRAADRLGRTTIHGPVHGYMASRSAWSCSGMPVGGLDRHVACAVFDELTGGGNVVEKTWHGSRILPVWKMGTSGCLGCRRPERDFRVDGRWAKEAHREFPPRGSSIRYIASGHRSSWVC
ncbi:hypothetical protein QBC47DRAFT_203307 [Echria macrotheca]|uniref:Uncharacterized protein n=1 Tax=Echria macrotheca TaxID=438768 RepID=A0AAJ0F911_9PEZI|nr:hypothetical protein QBC47DRAFT_203307 [Echria macrotheca]